MATELTPAEALRAVEALEAAWKRDDRALAALEDNGVGEQPLAHLIAEFGATVLETMVLTSTGASPLSKGEMTVTLSQYGLAHHLFRL